ncbi:hypothetical protein AF72_03560 [Xylella taiwanensis]|uniref:Uncharacterized protein n=1 Tax=Xylella taiwanensis TaxID=1444770 RepID=Z9JL03_9GAMM|nr:hypothetical protein AF72_03560 [Xylella taiwanensis]
MCCLVEHADSLELALQWAVCGIDVDFEIILPLCKLQCETLNDVRGFAGRNIALQTDV